MEQQHDHLCEKSSIWVDALEHQRVEHWDDDDFANLDDIQFQTASRASSTISWQPNQPSHTDRRDSFLSQLSTHSHHKSNHDDMDWVDFDGPLRLCSALNPHNTTTEYRASHDADGLDDDFDVPCGSAPQPRQAPTKIRPNETNHFGRNLNLMCDQRADVPTVPIQIQAPTPRSQKQEADDFEADLELPKDGILRRRQPSTPSGALHQPDDLDLEWAEGSLGTRNARTRRDGRSNRSSSVSAFSPSMSSAITESEDEGLDGLILPAGPLRFKETLQERQESQSHGVTNYSGEHNAAKRAPGKDDFFAGIEVGDGDIFDIAKLKLNRNIRHKIQPQTSPSRRPATTLAFTDSKPGPTVSRLPRFQPAKGRARPTLEPVSESGNTVSQPLRTKRSMPVIKTPKDRAESRLGDVRRPPVPFLPAGASISQSQHISVKPATTGHYRRNGSDGSSDGNFAGLRSYSRLTHRPETPGRSGTARGTLTPAELVAAAKKTITKPTRRRNFGEGNELDIFDDLPTSAAAESKFTKQPVAKAKGAPGSLRSRLGQSHAGNSTSLDTRSGEGNELDTFDDLPTSATVESKFTKQPVAKAKEAPGSLRSRLGQSHVGNSTTSLGTRSGAETPMPITPLTPNRPELNVPRFARDTAASRIAREQRQVATTYNPREPTRGPLTPISDNGKAHMAARPTLHAPSSRKRGRKIQQKPHLIKPLGEGHLKEPKSEKGMQYNPLTFKWEGNENDLEPFEIPAFHPAFSPEENRSSKPPALITNVGQAGGVQIIGEMVFDPSRMCWLKMAPAGVGGSLQLEEEDVFSGLADLEEETGGGSDGGDGLGPAIGEEFDVGPAFIEKQKAEEERWRKIVQPWLRPGETMNDYSRTGWRWKIREVVGIAARE